MIAVVGVMTVILVSVGVLRAAATPFVPYLVKDIYPGSTGVYANSSAPRFGAALDSTTGLLNATDGTNGSELWTTDGTAVGTVLVKDIRSGVSGSDPLLLINVGGSIFFTANDGTNGGELWKSDGSTGGTVLVKDVRPGASGGVYDAMGGLTDPKFTNAAGTLFFVGSDGTNGKELWKSDGSAGGTVQVKNIHPTGDSSPDSLAAVGGTVFFKADDGTNGKELWKSDGTEAGTVLVKDIRSGSSSSSPIYTTAVGSTVFFKATDGSTSHGYELWKSDGTEAGTVMVKDIVSGSSGGLTLMNFMANVGGTLLLTADNSGTYTDLELWRSDGTDAGTYMVKDINPSGSSDPGRYGYYGVCGEKLFFGADDGVHGKELWVSDGTGANTFLVKDINAGDGNGPRTFCAVGDWMFFVNETYLGSSQWEHELWVSDGTAGGTCRILDNFGYNGFFDRLFAVGDTLYFSGPTMLDGTGKGVNLELWAVTIPEPATLALLALGGVGLLARRRRGK